MCIRDGDGDRREKSLYQDGMDLCCGGAEFPRCLQEGGNVVDAVSMVPASGRPKAVDGGVIKEVCGPSPLRFSDGLTEVPDHSVTRLAPGGCDTGEGGLTVNIPPSEAPEVRCAATFEIPARDRVDVRV